MDPMTMAFGLGGASFDDVDRFRFGLGAGNPLSDQRHLRILQDGADETVAVGQLVVRSQSEFRE